MFVDANMSSWTFYIIVVEKSIWKVVEGNFVMRQRVILADIDGVLAINNMSTLFQLFNRVLKLEITEEQLALVHTEEAFDQLPQVQQYQDSVGREYYLRQIARLNWHPHYIFALNVIKGAPQGVRYLAQHVSDLGYCTARVINFHEQWNEHLARVTRMWLKKHAVPCEHQVIFCDGIKAKLETIARRIRKEGCQVLLRELPFLVSGLGSSMAPRYYRSTRIP
jgi:hypothetical protein